MNELTKEEIKALMNLIRYKQSQIIEEIHTSLEKAEEYNYLLLLYIKLDDQLTRDNETVDLTGLGVSSLEDTIHSLTEKQQQAEFNLKEVIYNKQSDRLDTVESFNEYVEENNKLYNCLYNLLETFLDKEK